VLCNAVHARIMWCCRAAHLGSLGDIVAIEANHNAACITNMPTGQAGVRDALEAAAAAGFSVAGTAAC
jgi:hypothetical protein